MSPVKMKQLIFGQLKDAQAVVARKEHNASQVLTWRGNHVPQQRIVSKNSTGDWLKYCLTRAFFCGTLQQIYATIAILKNIRSKLLSNYMMQILVMRLSCCRRESGKLGFEILALRPQIFGI